MAKELICSFCGRCEEEVEKLIVGKSKIDKKHSLICNYCIKICKETIDNYENNKKHVINIPNPKQIFDGLSNTIVGQEEAKKILSIAIYNHFKRIGLDSSDLTLEKSNILLLGKTGSGKSALVESLSKLVHYNFVRFDASSITEAGYMGEDYTSPIKALLEKVNFDVKRLNKEGGIIMLDEIDKLAADPSAGKDISGRGAQNSLLTLLDSIGTTISINIPSRKGIGQETLLVDTKNILFIAAGAFENLPNIIMRDIKSKISVFVNKNIEHSNYQQILQHMTTDHLIQFGLIPELLGRFPVRVVLNELNEEDLENIMTKPKNALLKQYKKLLQSSSINLLWTSNAVKKIAKKAFVEKTGARGLKTIIELILKESMFSLPNLETECEILIDEDTVDTLNPRITILKSKI